MKYKNFFINASLITTSFLVPFFIFEMGIRGYYSLIGRQRIFQTDSEIGWVPKANIEYKKLLTTYGGRKHIAKYSTDRLGLRFSNIDKNRTDLVKNNRKKILIIGDSFTGDFFYSDIDGWFAKIDESLPYDVFAYGIPGSGSLQQWLSFKRLQKEIKADILLIQFCSNDIENDSLELGYNSILRNQDLRRPYLINGKIEKRKDLLARFYRFMDKYSLAFNRLDIALQRFEQNYLYNGNSARNHNTLEYKKKYINAIKNWKNIYSLYVNDARSNGIKEVWSVSCVSRFIEPKIVDEWLLISKKLKVDTYQSFADSVYFAADSGIDVYHKDGAHLNDLGNKIAGEALVNEIRKIKKID